MVGSYGRVAAPSGDGGYFEQAMSLLFGHEPEPETAPQWVEAAITREPGRVPIPTAAYFLGAVALALVVGGVFGGRKW